MQIVGAGRGVGRSLALQLSDLGVSIICVDRNEANNQETIELMKCKGNSNVYSYCCDITVKKNIEDLAKYIEREVGFVTMLFHCCGIPSPRSLSSKPQDIHGTMDLTLTSYIWVSPFFSLSNIYRHTVFLFL